MENHPDPQGQPPQYPAPNAGSPAGQSDLVPAKPLPIGYLPPPPNPPPPPPPVPPQPIIVKYSGGTLMFLITCFGWVGFLMSGLVACLLILLQVTAFEEYFDTTGGIEEVFHSGDEYADDKIAIIDVSGVIMEGDGFVKRQIDRIRDDDDVRAVVVRVNTPGGTITGSDYIYHHLNRLRVDKDIPMVVSMGSMATSGGYYVSMAVGDQDQSIFAEPTTTTGSIGVIIPHYDISGLMADYNIRDDSIVSHERKQMLSMTRPISEEHRQILQGYVDESFERFKEIVKQGRPVFATDSDALDQLATGEIFTAEKAKGLGLVDEIGFIEDAIRRASKLAGLRAGKARVVRFRSPATLLDELSGMVRAGSGRIDLETLLELNAPRGYYISTSLPPLVSSRRLGR